MKTKNDNVIIFPKWKDTLEEESLQALKEKRYEDALKKLNELIGHEIYSHEIFTGKIICLMELGKTEDAEELCRRLIAQEDDYYFEYLHIYLTLLFQMSEYKQLIEIIEDVFASKTVVEPFQSQLKQLSEMSKKLSQDKMDEQAYDYINELGKAVKAGDSFSQWRLLVQCRGLAVAPYIQFLKRLLKDQQIDPVVKTAIIEWMQEQQIDEDIAVDKLGFTITVNPSKLKGIDSHAVTKQIHVLMREVEQDNPSLFQLLENLLYRYLYVRYPVMPEEKDLVAISHALKIMGAQYLQLEAFENTYRKEAEAFETDTYLKEIAESQKRYFSIIEE
ncbi:tetratricopeptide repeat protein [Sediminibacillus albus]|uniref:Tetratricopeptide repeat-containing protein n=1 Tax=Sediminibacillus albus TaxID=407036 RepID=A0A1G9BQ45_9BACI|nr:tetratricopeptide repeat protein [Sediminibacillus albus]SDK41576.1 hypothetical protein SAMN05216243_3068 [Sediminibacillus albus]